MKKMLLAGKKCEIRPMQSEIVAYHIIVDFDKKEERLLEVFNDAKTEEICIENSDDPDYGYFSTYRTLCSNGNHFWLFEYHNSEGESHYVLYTTMNGSPVEEIERCFKIYFSAKTGEEFKA